MSSDPERMHILDEFRRVASELGRAPSRSEFGQRTGLSESRILQHFPSYREAVRAAGLEPDTTNIKLDDGVLLEDYGRLIREHRQVPTRQLYKREGKYSSTCLERHFGPWKVMPARFRDWAADKPEWRDVFALLPTDGPAQVAPRTAPPSRSAMPGGTLHRVDAQHSKLDGLPLYGDPIDFRGLRHEPVNEQGVVFLFGMVARELGYLVEAVQTGFPDCEAKRQVGPAKWQRVRIEFEFESRNYRDHGHPCEACDVVVCWRHNWPECPIEVLELSQEIKRLPSQR